MDLLGAVDADAAGAHVAGPLQEDARPGRRHVGHREALVRGVGDRLVVDADPGQHLLVADAAARIGIRDLDQLGQGVGAVPVDVGGDALRHRPQHPADHQAAVVVAGQEALDHDPAVARLGARHRVAGAHRIGVGEVEDHAPAVVAVERLDRHRVVDPLRGRDRLVGVAHHLGARHRHAGPRQQLVGELLVRRDVDAQRAGVRGHGGPDPLLVDAVAELHQRRLVEADPGDVAQARLVEQRLGRGAERRPLGEPHELLELGREVEAGVRLDQVVDQPHGEPARPRCRPSPRRTRRRRGSAPARRCCASCRARPRSRRRAGAGGRRARPRARPRCRRAAAWRSRRRARWSRSAGRRPAAARAAAR